MLSKRWARLSIALSPLVLSACGSDRGHDPSEDGDDGGTSGSRATGGASGTGSATGGTGGSGAPSVCRVYASRYVRENEGTETFYTCAFDRQSLTLSCSEEGAERTFSDTWATIEDAVQENRPLGKLRMVSGTEWARYTTPAIICAFTFDYTYDSLGRLTSIVSIPASETCIAWDYYFDSWDAEGRPTLGHAVQDAETCSEGEFAYEYDDVNRVITFTSSGVGAGCESGRDQSTWDENGLLQSVANDSGSVSRFTTLETGEICRGGG
jgi:hypothetical protein